jgi:hypothetical protein
MLIRYIQANIPINSHILLFFIIIIFFFFFVTAQNHMEMYINNVQCRN